MPRATANRKFLISLGLLTTLFLTRTSIANAFVTLSSFQAKPATAGKSSGIVLTWATGTEVNSAGFNIYRSEHIDGPYVRVNIQLIPSSVGLVAGGTYEFYDTNALPDRTYYYQLEDVELTGTSTRHPPVKTSVPSKATDNDSIMIVGLAGVVMVAIAGLGVFTLKKRQSAKLIKSVR